MHKHPMPTPAHIASQGINLPRKMVAQDKISVRHALSAYHKRPKESTHKTREERFLPHFNEFRGTKFIKSHSFA